MCGILYAHRLDKFPVGKSLLKRYEEQKKRGQRGFGFIAIEGGLVKKVHRYEYPTDFEHDLRNSKSNTILAHHRLPTSTPNVKDATHPIHVRNKELEHDYYLIHNGVLANEDELKIKHEKLGYEYTTTVSEIKIVKTRSGETREEDVKFNDSEALAIEVARYLDGKSETIDTLGSAAFICFETDKKGKLLYVHYARNNGNPLKVESNGDLFYLKSEGDGIDIQPHVLFSIDYKTNITTNRPVHIGRIVQASPPVNMLPSGRRSRDDEDDWYGKHYDGRGRMGFRDEEPNYGFTEDELPFRETSKNTHATLSPIQRNNLLDWGEEDDGQILDDLPVIQVDYEKEFEDFKHSDDYLLTILYEIEELERDIARCVEIAENGGPSNSDEAIYDLEYLSDCEAKVRAKKKEYKDIEDAILSGGFNGS